MILRKLLIKNRIYIDSDEFHLQYKSHPFYNTLQAMTDVLDYFNIENISAKLKFNKKIFHKLPKTTIVQIKKNKNDELVLLEKSRNKKYHLTFWDNRKETVSENDLLGFLTGIILIVDDDKSKKSKITVRNALNNLSFLIFITSSFSFIYLLNLNLDYFIPLVTSIIGSIISILIVRKEFGYKDDFVNAICIGNSKNKDCDAVLNSKGANLTKDIKLSDLAIVFFIGSLLNVVLIQIQQLDLRIVYLINILTLPATIYSIIYQAFIVKKWCLLCLSLILLIWLNVFFFVFFILRKTNFDFIPQEWLTMLICFSSVFLSWVLLKPVFLSQNENKKLKYKFLKFKRNFKIFIGSLTSNKNISTYISNVNEIILGNVNTNFEIVVVTNPLCSHCKTMHNLIEDILKLFNQKVKIVIRFNIDIENKNNDALKICLNLNYLYHNSSNEFFLDALRNAYTQKPSIWLQKWESNNTDINQYYNLLERQKRWCRNYKVNFTPQILINGYLFPKEYERTDLLYFIDELVDYKF